MLDGTRMVPIWPYIDYPYCIYYIPYIPGYKIHLNEWQAGFGAHSLCEGTGRGGEVGAADDKAVGGCC